MFLDKFADFLFWGFAFILSTTLHEASHAFVAKLGGDDTAYSVGQASLNPLPHIRREPMGMILFPIITFVLNGGNYMIGWASAPYDPNWAARYPRRSAIMALAGPASNAVLAAFSFAVLKWGLGYSLTAQGTGSMADVVGQLFFILLELNLILAIFNLIPFPPLDGSEIILLFFPENRANDIRHSIRSMGFFGLLIAWVIFPFIFQPVARFVFQFLM